MAKSHQVPTPTTIKELYGTASRCAFPGCQEPLYRQASSGSGRVLNSEVCHICARSEGGARWDSAQTEDENRSTSNLLLMCFPHHTEVDDLSREADFPAATLLEWKAQQLQAIGSSLPINEKEIEEIQRRSFPTQPIVLNAGVINLGGQGGNEIGAGGGGGGAIGHGSRGGDGGPSGVTRHNLNATDAAAWGAGGGGAGSLALSRLEWPAYPGRVQHAASGRDEAGDKGAAEAGSGLRLTSLYLAECVRIANGLIYSLGAGWEHVEVAAFPADVAPALVCTVHMTGVDPDLSIKLNATVRDPAGVRALEQEFLVSGRPARAVVQAFAAITLRFTATQPGVWSIAICEGSAELGWIPLEVRQKPA